MTAAAPRPDLGGGGDNAARAWTVVVFGCLLYAASMVDRFIPTLLIVGLTKDLAISPLEFGLLVGTAFGVLFAAVSFPAAYMIDRSNRSRIVACGVITWSLATIACGFAGNFHQVLVARAGVAMGEAVLMPAIMSMISDLFPAGRRTRPTAVFSGTGMVMGTGLFLLSGAAIAGAGVLAPLLGLAQWRTTFVIVGVLPLIIGIAWLVIVREPARKHLDADTRSGRESAIAHLKQHRRLFLPLLIGCGLGSMFSFSLMGWTPAILIRGHGLSMVEAASSMGLVGVVPCVLGAMSAPTLSHWAHRAGHHGAIIAVGSCYLGIALAALLLTIQSPSAPVVLAGFGVTVFGLAGFNVLPLVMVQWIVPPQLCGRFTATVHFASSTGFAIGPPLVAFVATRFIHDTAAPSRSLSIVVAGAVLIALMSLALASRAFARRYRESASLRVDGRAAPTGVIGNALASEA